MTGSVRSERVGRQTLVAVAASVSLSLAAISCSSDGEPAAVDTTATPASTMAVSSNTAATAEPEPYTVWVDNNSLGSFPATYEYFFPDQLTVHPGATVGFEMAWSSGEPHNVAVGTVVDSAREAIDAVPPQAMTISPGSPLPVAPKLQAQFAKMPQALPPDQATTADTMRLAQPCYIETGFPPLDEPCGPDQRIADRPFDGTQSYLSSQVMIADGDRFELEVDPSIAPGQYTFICTLHPSFMYGSLNVVPETEPADTPTEVAERGQAAIDELNEQYLPVAEALAAQTASPVAAGALGDDGNRPEITINVFPTNLEAKVDEPVIWNIVGAHMLSFFATPPERWKFEVLEEVDGIVRPLEWQPDDPGKGQPGMPAFDTIVQSIATGDDVKVDGGTVVPDDYLHSGLLFGSLGPLPNTLYQLEFSDPGVYTYVCIRHPGMAGSVTVTP